MYKVKVIKDFPFAKVGDVWDVDEHNVINRYNYTNWHVSAFKGFLERIEEEKTLEEKIENIIENSFPDIYDRLGTNNTMILVRDVIKQAKEYYLAAFHKVGKCLGSEYTPAVKSLRKAIENA